MIKCFPLSVDCPDHCPQNTYCGDDTNGECDCLPGFQYDSLTDSCCEREDKIYQSNYSYKKLKQYLFGSLYWVFVLNPVLAELVTLC